MKHPFLIFLCAVLLGTGVGVSQIWEGEPKVPTQPRNGTVDQPLSQRQVPSNEAGVNQQIAKLHIPFIANQGQADEKVSFYAHTFGGTVFVTRKGELVYSLPKVEGNKVVKRTALKEKLVGGKVAEVRGEGEALLR